MKIDQLTFTRFIAAISIVIYHYGIHVTPFSYPVLQSIFGASNLGVSYFFLLSGFILTIVYSEKKTVDKKDFWIARFARVYPLYLVSLLLILLPKFYTSGISVLLSTRMFTHSLLLQSWYPPYTMKWNYPAWSLSVEVFFYFIFPFLLFYFRKWRLNLLILFSLFLWSLSMIVCYWLVEKKLTADSNLSIFINFSPAFHLSTFILGIATGRIYREVKPVTNESILHGVLLLSALLFLVLLHFQSSLHLNFHVGIFTPLFIVIILVLSWSKKGISKFFSFPILILLGEISFGIYILQEPIRILFELAIGESIKSPELHFYMYLTSLIIISFFFYKAIEIPIRNFIKNQMKRQKVNYSIHN